MLNEKLLFVVWKYRIFSQYPLKTITGKEVEVLYPGELNTNAGPDFFNARVKINNIQWAGNIEIHQKTSDFIKHHHHIDKNYHSLILHVVFEHDINIDTQLPYSVEIIELKNFISLHTIQQYKNLINSQQNPACIHLWHNLDTFIIQHWLERIAIERLEKKITQIQNYFNQTKNYQETFYRLFCRHLGFKVNNESFEKLSEKLPLRILLKHSDRLEILEALIYGTAGFLNYPYKDKYLTSLQNEFEFLKKKYNIEPLEAHLWKFAKMRPSNFPSLRLHQLALILHKLPYMFQDPADFFTNTNNLSKLYISPQGYFTNHINFNEDKFVSRSYTFGDTAIQHILINVIVPYLFFYGKSTGNDKYQYLALNYLEKVPPENNAITRKFENTQYITSALYSQALLELYPYYCEPKRCTECGIGIKLISHHQ